MKWSKVSANGILPPYVLRNESGEYDRHPARPGEHFGRIREHMDEVRANQRLAELNNRGESAPAKRPGIYLMSRYSRKAELQSYIPLFERAGLEVTSRWLTIDQHAQVGVPNPTGADVLNSMTVEQQGAIAKMDLADIRAAKACVAFTEPAGSEIGQRGGRLVEYGYALGLHKPIVICGPRESFFFMLDWAGIAQRDTPEEAAELLYVWAQKGHLK